MKRKRRQEAITRFSGKPLGGKHYFILEATERTQSGKCHKWNALFYGTAEEAHKHAEEYQADLSDNGYYNIRVAVLRVDATTYCGTIRGDRHGQRI